MAFHPEGQQSLGLPCTAAIGLSGSSPLDSGLELSAMEELRAELNQLRLALSERLDHQSQLLARLEERRKTVLDVDRISEKARMSAQVVRQDSPVSSESTESSQELQKA